MPVYIGSLLPTKTALKKNKLEILTRALEAPNKKLAEALLTTQFYTDHSELVSSYHDVKVCEDKPGMPRPAIDTWDTSFTWNKETGEIELIEVPEPEYPEEEITSVMKLPTNFRAAVLVLFGPVEGITKAEYSRVIDLVNDDDASPARELAEAISRTPRILALLPERQTELLKAVREGVKETAQWPDFKKFMDKWLDMPPAQRDASVSLNSSTSAPGAVDQTVLRTPSGATAGGRNQTDRGVGFVMTHDILALEIALALVGREVDFDIYNPPASIVNRAREIINTKEKPFPQWFEAWRNMPGGMDYSRAITIYSVKCAPEGLAIAPGRLIEYLNKTLTETDHEHPSAEIVAAACGLKPQDKAINEDETQQNETSTAGVLVDANAKDGKLAADTTVADEPAQEVRLGRAMSSPDKLETCPDDTRLSMSDREIEIAYAVDDLISGHTGVMSKDEAQGVITCTGHLISVVLPLIVADIATTEFCLSPDFSDEEIHHVATSILDAWSDNEAERQIVALDAITELRTEPPAPAIIEEPIVKPKPRQEPVEIPTPVVHATSAPGLTYRQQLTIAAIQGLCANPACFGVFDEIAEMALTLANAADRENV